MCFHCKRIPSQGFSHTGHVLPYWRKSDLPGPPALLRSPRGLDQWHSFAQPRRVSLITFCLQIVFTVAERSREVIRLSAEIAVFVDLRYGFFWSYADFSSIYNLIIIIRHWFSAPLSRVLSNEFSNGKAFVFLLFRYVFYAVIIPYLSGYV